MLEGLLRCKQQGSVHVPPPLQAAGPEATNSEAEQTKDRMSFSSSSSDGFFQGDVDALENPKLRYCAVITLVGL